MERIREHIDNLIMRFAGNELTSEEENELLNWIEQNSDNRSYFKEQLHILRSLKHSDVHFNAHQSLFELTGKELKAKSSRTVPKWIAVAASVIFIIGLGWLWFQNQNSSPQNTTYVADKNKPLVCVLEDNSEVTLSKNSVLISPIEFDKKARSVILKGKAFFEIEENKNKPFEIVAGNFLIRVLGTSFEVDMDTLMNELCVSVQDGRVSLQYTPTGHSLMLGKNQQICLSLNGKIIRERSLTNENYLSWKTGVLEFDNTPMSEVARELEKLYNKPVIFKHQQIGEYMINTKISNQSFAQINTIFEVTLNITMVDMGNKIVIMSRDSIN